MLLRSLLPFQLPSSVLGWIEGNHLLKRIREICVILDVKQCSLIYNYHSFGWSSLEETQQIYPKPWCLFASYDRRSYHRYSPTCVLEIDILSLITFHCMIMGVSVCLSRQTYRISSTSRTIRHNSNSAISHNATISFMCLQHERQMSLFSPSYNVSRLKLNVTVYSVLLTVSTGNCYPYQYRRNDYSLNLLSHISELYYGLITWHQLFIYSHMRHGRDSWHWINWSCNILAAPHCCKNCSAVSNGESMVTNPSSVLYSRTQLVSRCKTTRFMYSEYLCKQTFRFTRRT